MNFRGLKLVQNSIIEKEALLDGIEMSVLGHLGQLIRTGKISDVESTELGHDFALSTNSTTRHEEVRCNKIKKYWKPKTYRGFRNRVPCTE